MISSFSWPGDDFAYMDISGETNRVSEILDDPSGSIEAVLDLTRSDEVAGIEFDDAWALFPASLLGDHDVVATSENGITRIRLHAGAVERTLVTATVDRRIRVTFGLDATGRICGLEIGRRSH